MTRHYRLDTALLETGWAHGALVTVTDDGIINAIEVPAVGSRGVAYVPGAVGTRRSGDTPQPAGMAAATDNAGSISIAAPAHERITGVVVPGMPNAHSHAFQRGMAGNTEYRL